LNTPIAKEVLALEDAIRQVTIETPSNSRPQTGTPPRAETAAFGLLSDRANLPQPNLPGSGLAQAMLPARQRLLLGRSSRKRQQVANVGDVLNEVHHPGAPIAEAPQSARREQNSFERVNPEYPAGRSSRLERTYRDAVHERQDAPATTKAPQSSSPHHPFEAVAPQCPPAEKAAPIYSKRERHIDQEGSDAVDYDTRQPRDPDHAYEAESEQQEALEPAYEPEGEELLSASLPHRAPSGRHAPSALHAPSTQHTRPARPAQPRASPEKKHKQKRPPLSYRGLARLLAILLILAGVTATLSWQWPTISELYQLFKSIGDNPVSRIPAGTESSPGIPQEHAGAQPPGTPAQSSQTAMPMASLIEADVSDPQGKRYVGSVAWHTETLPGRPGPAPELAIRGDIEIPQRGMKVSWLMRLNTDKSLPASHTIEIKFELPADSAVGGVAEVAAIVMKQSEQARGNKLAARIAKVTSGFFLIGLSADDTEVQRNKLLLKDHPWLDIGIVYNNGKQAILAVEKGESGNRAFVQAFAAWEKK
jgi:hypothetical protein